MGIYYVDPYNGTDYSHGASGLTWDTAYKTISGITRQLYAVTGQTIRVAKSRWNDPSINANWYSTNGYMTNAAYGFGGGGNEVAKTIGSSTNTNPITIVLSGHGYANNDIVHVQAHTTNVSANGFWILTGVTTNSFDLVSSIGMGAGGAVGNVSKVNAKTILLDTPLTKNIHLCDYYSATLNNWTPGTNVTSANLSTTVWKEGYSSVAVVCAAGVGQLQILAKSATPTSLDLSAYSGISFKLQCTTLTNVNDNHLVVKLYSDTGCTVEVESLAVPKVSLVANVFHNVVINKGAALSNDVKGIALYASGATFTSKTFYIDNFIAIYDPTNPKYLTHATLISTNPNEQVNSGNTEGRYGTKCINDRIVIIDNHTASMANNGRGYWGRTGNFPIYLMEPIDTNGMAGGTTGTMFPSKAGVAGSWCYIEFGYNTGTTTIDGETWLDANNIAIQWAAYTHIKGFIGITRASNIGSVTTSPSYQTYDNLMIINATLNIGIINAYYWLIDNLWYCNNNSAGIYVVNAWVINKIWNVNNNLNYGLTLGGSGGQNPRGSLVKEIGNICNNIQGLLMISNNWDLKVGLADRNGTGVISSNNYVGIFSAHNKRTIYVTSGITNNDRACSGDITLNGCGSAIISGNYYFFDVRDLKQEFGYNSNIYNFASISLGTAISDGYFLSYWQDNSITLEHKNIYLNYNTIIQDTGVTYSGSSSWKLSILGGFMAGLSGEGYIDYDYDPLYVTIGRVYVTAGSPVSISAYMKKSHLTNIGGELYLPPFQLKGMILTGYTAPCTDTDWQKVTLPSFTPTENGVVRIMARAWYINSATDSVWVDNLEITQ